MPVYYVTCGNCGKQQESKTEYVVDCVLCGQIEHTDRFVERADEVGVDPAVGSLGHRGTDSPPRHQMPTDLSGWRSHEGTPALSDGGTSSRSTSTATGTATRGYDFARINRIILTCVYLAFGITFVVGGYIWTSNLLADTVQSAAVIAGLSAGVRGAAIVGILVVHMALTMFIAGKLVNQVGRAAQALSADPTSHMDTDEEDTG